MKRKDKIYNSPEYKEIKDHLPELLEEMEKDKEKKEFQIPEGWNDDFEQIYQAERRKERIRIRLIAGACCGVILAIGIGHLTERLEGTSVVQADEIGETKENGFEDEQYHYNTYGNMNEDDLAVSDDTEVLFNEDSLDVLQENIRKEIKRPMFYLTDIPEKAIIKDARYNRVYNNISFRIYVEKQYVYVSQQKQIESSGNGNISEKNLMCKVYNENLEEEMLIYRSTQDDSFKVSFLYDNTVLSMVSNLNLEEFEKIVQSVTYK